MDTRTRSKLEGALEPFRWWSRRSRVGARPRLRRVLRGVSREWGPRRPNMRGTGRSPRGSSRPALHLWHLTASRSLSERNTLRRSGYRSHRSRSARRLHVSASARVHSAVRPHTRRKQYRRGASIRPPAAAPCHQRPPRARPGCATVAKDRPRAETRTKPPP